MLVTAQTSLERNAMHPGAFFPQQTSQHFMAPPVYHAPPLPVDHFIAMPPPPHMQYVAMPPQAYGHFAQVSNNQVNFSFQPDAPQIPPALFHLYQQNRKGMFQMVQQPAYVHDQHPPFMPEQHPIAVPKMLPTFSQDSLPIPVFACPPSPSPTLYPMMETFHSQTLPEVQLPPSSMAMECQPDYQLGPQEAVWQAQYEAEREQCNRELIDAKNKINAVKRLVKKNEFQRWSDKEKKAVDNLMKAMDADWTFWADSVKNMELLKIYTEIVGEMAKLIEFETKRLKKKNRKLDLLVAQFQKNTLSYLKQNDFNVKKAVEFENYEKTRTLKALVRLFKCMQLLPLTQSNPEKKDSGLRGDTVVRNRCKRLTSFQSQAHKFDAYLLELIKNKEVDIDGMYVCRDHKSEKKGKKKKARVMAGLLFYFVCPSSSAAENLLRKFCQFCEAEGESAEVKDIHQKMFRKDDSRKGDQAKDRLKRQRLCSGEAWTKQDFQNQKDMYHFALALSSADTFELFLQNVNANAVRDNDMTIKARVAKAIRIPASEVDIKNMVQKPNGTVIQFAIPTSKNDLDVNAIVTELKSIKWLRGFQHMQIPIRAKAEMEKSQPTCPTRPVSRRGSFDSGYNGSVGF